MANRKNNKIKLSQRARKAFFKQVGRKLTLANQLKRKNKIDDTSSTAATLLTATTLTTAPQTNIKLEVAELNTVADVDFQAQAPEQSNGGSEDIKPTLAPVCAGTSLPSDASDDDVVASLPLLNNIIPYIVRTKAAVSSPNVNVKRDINAVSSPEPWTVSKSLCRCCHTEGDFDSMTSAQGDEPPPYDTLLHVFHIQLCPTKGAGSCLRGICALCLARLSDAYHFLQQVRACDQHFTQMYNSGLVKVNKVPGVFQLSKVKQEATDDGAMNEPRDDTTGPTDRITNKKLIKNVPGVFQLSKVKQEATDDGATDAPRDDTTDGGPTDRKNNEKRIKEKPPRPRCSVQTGDVYKCIKCDTCAPTALKIRMHYHVAHTRVQCDHCDETFRTTTRLLIHKLETHKIDDRFKCNACGKGFCAKGQLKKHMDSFHMMGVRVTCPMCSFETYGQDKLKRHLINHTGPRKYQCRFCSKSFRRPKTLDYHQRIHTGDKRQKCAECGQTFVQKASLNYHMAKHHPSVRF